MNSIIKYRISQKKNDYQGHLQKRQKSIMLSEVRENIKDKMNQEIKDNLKDTNKRHIEIRMRETLFFIIEKSHKILKVYKIILSLIDSQPYYQKELEQKIISLLQATLALETKIKFSNSDFGNLVSSDFLENLYLEIRQTEELFKYLIHDGFLTNSNFEKIQKKIHLVYEAINYLIDLQNQKNESRIVTGASEIFLSKDINTSHFKSEDSILDSVIDQVFNLNQGNAVTENVHSGESSPGKAPSRQVIDKRQNDKNVFDALKTIKPSNDKEPLTKISASFENNAPTKSLEIKQRRAEIQNLLRIEGKLNISQVSEHFKDCSEKTIQRDLNHLIKKGLVKREGQKRWSNYLLV